MVHLALPGDVHLLDVAAHPVGEDVRIAQAGAAREHHELLAAPASDEVLSPHHPHEHRRGQAQHRISGEMSERVVHPLEVIDVDDDERERRPMPDRIGHLSVQSLVEIAAIVEVSERVPHGRVVEPALRLVLELVVQANPQHGVLADVHPRAVMHEQRRLKALAVHERAIPTTEILDPARPTTATDAHLLAR